MKSNTKLVLPLMLLINAQGLTTTRNCKQKGSNKKVQRKNTGLVHGMFVQHKQNVVPSMKCTIIVFATLPLILSSDIVL